MIRLSDLGQVYIVCGGSKDRFKALYWDDQGFWILYNRMFYLERTWENLSKQERYQLRQEKLKPLMQEFFNWCEKNKTTVLPGSKLRKAINYTLKHQETFEHILLDGNLELYNNKAKRAVISLVMGRFTKL